MSIFIEVALHAEDTLYVDPEWNGGTQCGSSSFPWQSLSKSAWDNINKKLMYNDVMVIFSAYAASKNRENVYDSDHDLKQNGIELMARTAATKFNLTFDGGSLYNTCEMGIWKLNRTTKMCKIKHFNSQNSSQKKISHIKINKFRIEKNDDGKALTICGDSWVISNCDIYHTKDVKDGPLVLLVPVADKRHGGSDYNAPACSCISIVDNQIHSSCGELIYLGGGGCTNADSTGINNCQGFPSHTNITISGNTLYEGGVYGGEGDAIDCKGGISNLFIVKNVIHNMHSSQYRAITLKGQNYKIDTSLTVIEKNYIHHCTGLDDAAIAIVNNWGTPGIIAIQNNIIVFNDRTGILVYGGKNIEITYNTICNNSGYGVAVLGGRVSVKNNLLIDNSESIQLYSISKNLFCLKNGFSGGQVRCCNQCISNLNGSIFSNADKQNYSIVKTTELQIGTPSEKFFDDFNGQIRSNKAWTLGALEQQ
jgi:hypothetical protein